MAHFAAGRHGEAFERFTEAIRLHPRSAVYHCNRAAAALKLGRAGIAAEDAEHAIAQDGSYAKAHLRAGRARLQMRDAQRAAQHFSRASELDPGCSAAQKGGQDALQLEQQQRAAREREQAQADAGARPALSRLAAPQEQAALQLYSAEQMLRANSCLEAAKCARVEALVACSRYGDAAAACAELLDSTERLYLEAEALWRQGDLAAALNQVEAACRRAPDSAKCRELGAFLRRLDSGARRAAAAHEEGAFSEAMEACGQALDGLDAGACTGMYCSLLRQRADAAAARGLWAEALSDLGAAVRLEPGNAACLALRADVHKRAGAYTEYFLDLQRLKRAAPGTPGLGDLLEGAARLCLGAGRDGAAGGGGCGCGDPAAAGPALQTLGLTEGATAAQVRRAYLRLAAAWHPDKWAAAAAEAQAAAEERFKGIQAAYEGLTAQ
jgi:hypothetical protein